MGCKRKKQDQDIEELDEGQELCPDCGNLMIKEGGKLVCSSCSDTLDFLGDDEDELE
ncbi:hypothetical protein C4544_04115 [candidate division WS5 bacterium]|uniref:DNA-directed RNA polymerase II subunit RPB9-like zinc ribbon domain-containing protein n=1 Tax=candidate division WS5 bacterium TaxID=2093353 RepID=A0A419DCY4_9BACT|nr:MAG: hypothetical protein C4544_04115 [candidate division WS5 bacterium]